MPQWTQLDIRRQYEFAQRKGWLDAFASAAKDYDFTASLLMAIASRETNMRNIVGDHGHGYGIMQIDVGSFPDWCHSGIYQNASAGIVKGAQVLDMKRESIRLGQGKRLTVGGKAFTGKRLGDNDLIWVAVSAYNCGLWAYYNYSTGRDVDATSTGHDYGADTLKREQVFNTL